jgi:hypothetical protein
MPTEYTGVSTATQAPSPAPSFGATSQGDPVVTLPIDGETLNVSSVIQAMKVPGDWIAFFRRAFYGWTDISSDVSASKGSNVTGYLRSIGNLKVALVGVSALAYNDGSFTITVAGSHLAGARFVIATAQSTSSADEPMYAKADETSGNETSRTFTVYNTAPAQAATAAVQLLILSD